MPDDVLIYADTQRSATMRHEVPISIGDPFLYVERDGRRVVLTNVLEQERIARVLPDAELLLPDRFGLWDLVRGGMDRDAALLEVISRAVADVGVTEAAVPPELPVAVADRLRADGVNLMVDRQLFEQRRRVKSDAELAGIRRAQRAAEAGMAAAAALLRDADVAGDRLVLGGDELTAERVRAAILEACAAQGAPAPPDVMVTSLWSGGGHDPGSGPLPAHLPITIDLWPQDLDTGCSADMTRTFVAGEIAPAVAELHATVREALAAAKALVRPGVTGRELYDAAAEIVERAGHPTRRSHTSDDPLTHGFYFSLGHGVGLEVHEAPALGLSGHDPLVAGDVLALEPGIENLPGIGGVRLEDLVLVTDDGGETLTDYPDALTPESRH